MKRLRCLLLPFLAICALFFSFQATIIPTYAVDEKPNTTTDTTEEDDSNPNQEETTGCNSYATQEERDQCIKDRAANLSTAPFYSAAIMSLDSTISEKELTQDYVKNFSNSSVTALSYNLSLFDPDTIIMHIVNIVISLIEMIGQAISLVVLILYNVASGSFWKTIIQGVFEIFDRAIFDWGNPNSWFIKLLFLFGSLSVAMKLMSQWNKHFTINTLITITFQVVVSCMIIVFIAQYGRGIISNIEIMATESIVQNFNILEDQYDKNLPLEVNVKGQIFDIMQKQGFVLRHFGVTTADQIADVKNVPVAEGGTRTVTGKQRVQNLLNEPSQRQSYQERKILGNDQIGYSSGRVLAILGISVIFLIHRILMGFLIGSASLLLLAIGFLKEVTIVTSVYALVFMLFKKDKRLGFNWFFGRMKWMIAFILSNLLFNMFLSFIVLLINGISAQKTSLLIILPFDVILCLAIFYLVTHAPQLWQKLMEDFDIDGNDGIINLAKGVIGGDITPADMWNRFRNRNDGDGDPSDNVNNTPSQKTLSKMTKDNDELSESDNDSNDEKENSVSDELVAPPFTEDNTQHKSDNQELLNTKENILDKLETEELENNDLPENQDIEIDPENQTAINLSDDDNEVEESELPETDNPEILEDDEIQEITDDEIINSQTDNENYIKLEEEDLSESDTSLDKLDDKEQTSDITQKESSQNDKIYKAVDDHENDQEMTYKDKDNSIHNSIITEESVNVDQIQDDMKLAKEKEIEEEKTKDIDEFMELLND